MTIQTAAQLYMLTDAQIRLRGYDPIEVTMVMLAASDAVTNMHLNK